MQVLDATSFPGKFFSSILRSSLYSVKHVPLLNLFCSLLFTTTINLCCSQQRYCLRYILLIFYQLVELSISNLWQLTTYSRKKEVTRFELRDAGPQLIFAMGQTDWNLLFYLKKNKLLALSKGFWKFLGGNCSVASRGCGPYEVYSYRISLKFHSNGFSTAAFCSSLPIHERN